ncbi:MAG: hypothetical protein GTN49_00225 [candidate division Zixibacteria bacterium]|nr:hypothetical protein [candidate division Zixibacteria bacterium]
MVKRCAVCGAENPDEVASCNVCGTGLEGDVPPEVEIEVYDVEPVKVSGRNYFEETLAARRESVQRGAASPAADLERDPLIQEELKAGYEIRRRRISQRLRRPRGVAIVVAAAALAILVTYGVRWAVARLPRYEYAEPAYVVATNLALGVAAELESTRFDVAGAGGPTALLAVGGEGGKVFIDGNYVGDAPLEAIPVPLGRRRVIVRRGNEIALDESIDFERGVRYSLEPLSAAALARTR